VLEIMPTHANKTAPTRQSTQYKRMLKDNTSKHRDRGSPACQSIYYDSSNLGTSPLGLPKLTYVDLDENYVLSLPKKTLSQLLPSDILVSFYYKLGEGK